MPFETAGECASVFISFNRNANNAVIKDNTTVKAPGSHRTVFCLQNLHNMPGRE
jgi:hypothetical protein